MLAVLTILILIPGTKYKVSRQTMAAGLPCGFEEQKCTIEKSHIMHVSTTS